MPDLSSLNQALSSLRVVIGYVTGMDAIPAPSGIREVIEAGVSSILSAYERL